MQGVARQRRPPAPPRVAEGGKKVAPSELQITPRDKRGRHRVITLNTCPRKSSKTRQLRAPLFEDDLYRGCRAACAQCAREGGAALKSRVAVMRICSGSRGRPPSPTRQGSIAAIASFSFCPLQSCAPGAFNFQGVIEIPWAFFTFFHRHRSAVTSSDVRGRKNLYWLLNCENEIQPASLDYCCRLVSAD